MLLPTNLTLASSSTRPHAPYGFQESDPIALIGLEIGPFGPFIPGIDERQAVLPRMLRSVLDQRPPQSI